jgi:Glycosyl transferase family 2
LAHATGDFEVLAVLDGYWQQPDELPADPRLTILHHGQPLGMRPAINHAAAVASGEFLMKCDAHCSFEEGFDAVLKADYHEANWVVVPRRDRLDPVDWTWVQTGKPPVDAHYLSYPGEDGAEGLHGVIWKERAAARAKILLDEEMSSQGSCWFMSRAQWDRIGPLDVAGYGTFTQEFQEVGLKTWLGGGAVMVNKRTTYLHLHKQQRGYPLDGAEVRRGAAYCTDFWMTDKPWPGRCRRLRWLIEHFSPVPTWPADLDAVFRRAA